MTEAANNPNVENIRRPSWLERAGTLVTLLDQPVLLHIGLGLVLLLAAWFRFHGLNWDENHHLHPDERFLSTVTNDLDWPQYFGEYFDPAISTLSPYSLPNMGLYVYGTLPVYAVKWIAIQLGRDNYDQITLVGRSMSALFDLATILFLYLIARRLHGPKVGLLAAGLLSLSVLNIQLSHFYTVDTFANLFIVATIYFLLRAMASGSWIEYLLTGLMFGMGLASKVSALTLVAPVLVGAGLDFYRRSRSLDVRAAFEQTLFRLLTTLFVAALVFRVLQPIAFSGPHFLDWSLNPRWVEDITEQQKTVNGDADLPWVQQWTDRSAGFAVYNILVWGLGLPLGLAAVGGFAVAVIDLVKRRNTRLLLVLVYVTVTFIYHAATFIKFMRYFLPIYPFLALFAAYLIAWLWRRATTSSTVDHQSVPPRSLSWWKRLPQRLAISRPVVFGLSGIVIIGTLLYALAFSSIYDHTQSRIAASRWMHQNIPSGSILANEHWDDWLPIGGVDGVRAYGDEGMFQAVEMANYEDDTPEKLNIMVEKLTTADYIVLSSNRLYDSIPRLPMRYPLTIRYYQLLFEGRLGFERISEFTSYPTLLGISIPDQAAEESFSVYDHPRVQIYRKSSDFDPERVRQLLGTGIPWQSIMHLTPRQASAAPDGLQLTPQEQSLYRETAVWSSEAVSERSLGSQFPLLVWPLALVVIGLLALPVTLLTFRNLVDRGYALSKAVGLLLVGWAAWTLASWKIAPFTWWQIVAVMLLVALPSFLLVRRRWDELRNFVKSNWRLLAMEELLFWVFFGISLYIRLQNPDLWHPGMGGEKPMDLAYLTAVVKTPYFPSYDPWFSGGYINYYYFGFVLVATLIHLTGILPVIAYNLAVPTLFAMTAMGGFVAAMNLQQARENDQLEQAGHRFILPRKVLLASLAGALFVVLIGNLAQVKLLWEGVSNLSTLSAGEESGVISALARFTDGLGNAIRGSELPIHTDWWYWNATRVIPPGEGEAGPINEMPFFTFLFADLHAHMLALPYTLLALALIINMLRRLWHRSLVELSALQSKTSRLLNLGLLSLTLGALWPMNTWDFPTYTALAVAALVCMQWVEQGRLDVAGWRSLAWQVGVILIGAWLLFLPYHQNNASAYFGAELWRGSKTPLWAYLYIHGFFLFIIVTWMLLELMKGWGHNSLIRSIRLRLRYWRRPGDLNRLFNRLTRPASGYRLAIGLTVVAFLFSLAALMIKPAFGLSLGLGLLAALLLFERQPNLQRQMLLCMIGLGLALTAVVEVVVLKGDISRMNTVFKFYLQVWVLWAVASAALLPQISSRLHAQPRQKPLPVPEPPEGSTWTPQLQAQYERSRRIRGSLLGRGWWWAFGLLLAACLLYPLTATPVRVGDRFPGSFTTTLDGSAYMQTSVYYDDGRPVPLLSDLNAIRWLRQAPGGLPVVLEANTPLYRWGSRISIYTGFPTVMGWDWHQKQQRSVMPGILIDRRLADVTTIYNTTDVNQARALIAQYQVKFIYVGSLERLYYDSAGLSKFDSNTGFWTRVYESDEVIIYQVH